jgi:hypothetical protein
MRNLQSHYYVAMIKHDSLDKALLNDEALSKQQNLYGGSCFTSQKGVPFIMSLSSEVAR